ncbi:hypothetical protein TrVE_jg8749 [Triparma verrucosa]|uniref:EamA domain-containing protein n=1 Tax=Triparma verrucosa TaxID=1606542 RepID=A0A9W6ZEZ1_9STRA|nr:hypothetical protein TrVE_jg8749 [Triparma verrucosa]
MTATTGVLAATSSPLLMTIGFVIWDKEWKGSAFALNMFKGSLASVGFLLLSVATRLDSPFSSTVWNPTDVNYLVLSAVIGILIGDAAWLEALRIIGARRVILVDTLKPFLSALLGYFLLDESLNAWAYVGMVLTVVGVTVVSLEKDKGEASADVKGETEAEVPADKVKWRDGVKLGYFWAALNVILDCYGSVLTKQYGAAFTTWEIGLIRFGSASGIMILMSMSFIAGGKLSRREGEELPVHVSMSLMEKGAKAGVGAGAGASADAVEGETGDEEEKQTDREWFKFPVMTLKAYLRIALGVLLVTFICSALRNYALFEISLAMALTLGGIGPIYSLPIVWYVKNEIVTRKAVFFTFVSVVGIAVLCLLGMNDSENEE